MVGVYDLGGGTFDAAILRRTPAGFELIGRPEGIERLGGIDVDEAVFSHVVTVMGTALSGLDPEDGAVLSAVARLRQECIVAKEVLSQDTEVTIPVVLPGLSTEVRLTRSELESMIRPTLSPTVEALSRAVASAGLEPKDLSAVLLVGGSSRIPLVGQMVGASLEVPVVTDAHPKRGVASGAALYAEGAARTAPAAAPARPVRVGTPAARSPAIEKAAPEPAAPPPPVSPPPISPGRSEKGPSLPAFLPTWAWQTIAVVVVGALILTGLAIRNRNASRGDEIALLAADSPGGNPFTESGVSGVITDFDPDQEVVISPASASKAAVVAPRLGTSVDRPDGITSFRGATPGLFGGTRDTPACLTDVIESSLGSDSAAANAFLDGAGSDISDVSSHLADLTPVVLRGDTRVTSFSLTDDGATSRQVVLQAGTAVLVDRLGVPRVRCLSGSPLRPPVAAGSTQYSAQSWPDGRKLSVSAIVENQSPVESFVLIDLGSGKPFNRATGIGGTDSDHVQTG